MRFLPFVGLVVLVGSMGCGSKEGMGSVGKGNIEMKSAMPQAPGAQVAMAQEKGAELQVADIAKAAVPRKIKYTAEIGVIVEEIARAESKLYEIVEAHKGLIAKADIVASSGSAKAGTFKLRVPIDEFTAFCKEIKKLGDVEKDSRDSEDVTEAYYDLENHIKNRQAEVESLRKLLAQTNDKMENILTIRREINQVQDDLNRRQGQLRVLANLTDLATVNLTVREKKKFVQEKPPEIAEAPTFGTRVGKTFGDSMATLTTLGQNVTLVVVAATPWLPFVALVGVPSWLVIRRLRKRVAIAPQQ